MARYQYKAIWKTGEQEAMEVSHVDDLFCFGPDYIAAALQATIAARPNHPKDICVTIGAMVPMVTRPVRF